MKYNADEDEKITIKNDNDIKQKLSMESNFNDISMSKKNQMLIVF